ncbi:MAG: hypothetical protein JWL71_183 [Acidobacteria bacterium]|nr:hypothetical protein [Acidobacteriota bacterium]
MTSHRAFRAATPRAEALHYTNRQTGLTAGQGCCTNGAMAIEQPQAPTPQPDFPRPIDPIDSPPPDIKPVPPPDIPVPPQPPAFPERGADGEFVM